MKRDCKEFKELLADYADGRQAPGVEAHLQTCAGCRRELSILRAMVTAMQGQQFEPSSDALQRAIRLMPKKPMKSARLVLGQMSLVRSAGAEEFQMVFEGSGLHTRLMYQPLPEGWLVTGRVDGAALSIETASSHEIPMDDSGRFQFEVSDLTDTDLYIRVEDGVLKIPSAPEATPNDAD